MTLSVHGNSAVFVCLALRSREHQAHCDYVRLFLLSRIFSSDELILLDSGDDQIIDQWLEDHGRIRKLRYVESSRGNDEVYHQSICGDYPFDNMSLASHSVVRSRAGTV